MGSEMCIRDRISGYAIGVAVGAPVLTLLTRQWPRKRLLLALMLIFIAGNLAAAFAPSYEWLMSARVLTSLTHGTFFGVGAVVATGLVPVDKKASAIALMFSGLTLATLLGVPAELRTRATTVSGGLMYRLVDDPLGGRTVFGDQRSFRVEPIVGARWSKLRADLSTPLGATSKGADWTDLLLGLRVEADATDRWTLRGQVDIGGLGDSDRNSRSWQALAVYRTPLAGGAVSVNLGYRLLEQIYQQDDFTGQSFDWNVSRHGPVIGLSLTY